MIDDPVTAVGIATAIGWALLHSLWQAAIVWLAVSLFRRRVSDPTLRSRAADVGLLLLLLAQAITFAICLTHRDDWATTFTQPGAIEIDKFGMIKRLAPPTMGWTGKTATKLDPYIPLLVGCWSACSLIRLTLYARGAQLASRAMSLAPSLPDDLLAACERIARKLGVARTVRFVAIALTESPGTVGWLKPCVFIPPALLLSLTPAELEAIVTHELAHVLRRDYASSALRLIVESIYTANPFVAWIVRAANDDAEKSCDAIATRSLGQSNAYARALATLADRVVSSRAALHVTGGSLTDRVATILRPPLPTRGRTVWARAAMATAFVAMMLGLTSVTVSAAAANDREIFLLQQHSLGESARSILEPAGLRNGSKGDSNATVVALLRFARDDRSAASTLALMHALVEPRTFATAGISDADRNRLARARSFCSARTGALVKAAADPTLTVDEIRYSRFLETLKLDPIAQSVIYVGLRSADPSLFARLNAVARTDETGRLAEFASAATQKTGDDLAIIIGPTTSGMPPRIIRRATR